MHRTDQKLESKDINKTTKDFYFQNQYGSFFNSIH